MKLIIPTLLIFSLIACSKGNEPIDAFSECTEVIDNYKRYNGETIDCEYHYVLTEYNGQQYIELRAHCDDLIRSYVINEDCVDICEFISQMMALQNIETMKMYNVNKIVTACPHCFNTLKNEYPELGGNYDVVHHTQLIQTLLDEGKITINDGAFAGKKIAYHDSCYLGRINDIYESPRKILNKMDATIAEAPRNRKNGFCCGAGGAQVFKEEEESSTETKVNHERVEELLTEKPDIIAANCPYCILMMDDGVKAKGKEDVMVYDISELIVQANDW